MDKYNLYKSYARTYNSNLFFFTFINLIYRKPILNNYDFVNAIYEKVKANNLPKELFDVQLLGWILIYLAVTIAISFVIAQFCWKIVRTLDLDKRFSPLRFNNYWHYYLSGESLKFKEFRGVLPGKQVVLTEADVLIDIGDEGTKLYKGFIRQHTICKSTGDLKTIYLTDVRRYRRDLPPNNIKEVPGHIMIIPFEKIININLTYITRNERKINYYSLILILLNLSSLLFLMFNPFNLILRNTSIFGDLVGRFWLFIGWILTATLIDTFANSKNHKDVVQLRFGLLFFLLIIIIIIYYFFY